jgi:hypothetical protein
MRGEELHIGDLDEAVAAEFLGARVEEFARVIASHAPIAVRGMKRFNEIARNKLDKAAADGRHRESLHRRQGAVRQVAFAEKKPPRFLRRMPPFLDHSRVCRVPEIGTHAERCALRCYPYAFYSCFWQPACI